ncbi:MAG TPA: hypothetical protein DCS93_17180 [Microscillaceae bacterium]|nr:hypothetical protein [Microscillaceae bacterium]
MKKICTLVLCLLALSFSTQAQKKKKNDDLHITGGSEIDITETPYQVSIHRNGSHICGGSIINDRFVLTAAHCIDDITQLQVNELTIKAGFSKQSSPGRRLQQFQVVRVIPHSSYNPSIAEFDFDYALIEIRGRFAFNNWVQPVVLANPGSSAEAINNNVKVSGWGWTTPGTTSRSDVLRAVDVPIISNSTADTQLSAVLASHEPITSRMIATGAVSSDRLGACHEDSGGPLVYKPAGQPAVQVGIVSWGIGGCGGGINSPSMYARVSAAKNWIRANSASIDGSSAPCFNANTIYRLNSIDGVTVTSWQVSSGVQLVSSNSQTATIRVNSLGNTWIRATLSTGNTIQKNLRAERTPVINANIQWTNGAVGASSYLCSARTGNRYSFTVSGAIQRHQFRISNFSGQVLYTSSAFLTGTSGYLPDLFFPEGIYRFEIRGTNACGTAPGWTLVYVEFKSCFGLGGGGGGIGPAFGEVAPDFAIFPNPVNMGNSVNFIDKQTQQTKLTVKDNVLLQTTTEATNITVYNMQQQKVFSTSFRGQERKLDLSSLKTGVYHMRIQKGNKVEIKKILVR